MQSLAWITLSTPSYSSWFTSTYCIKYFASIFMRTLYNGYDES